MTPTEQVRNTLSTTVAFIGTGAMGAPMAVNLARAGYPVRAWNRTASRARALAKDGILVCAEQSEALDGASVVITMLSDGAAVHEAVNRWLRPGLLWAQMATVGTAATARLSSLATEAGVRFVDAPVLGTVGPAVRGELIVLAGGAEKDVRELQPIFDVLAARVVQAGVVGEATRLKLTLNLWSLLTVSAMAETIGFAERCGVRPEVFLDTIKGGGSDSQYARSKAELMLAREYEPNARLELWRKDLNLAIEAAEEGRLDLKLTAGAVSLMDRAIELGYGDADGASIVEALRTT